MHDLERLVRAARPPVGAPLPGAEERILAGLGLTGAPARRGRGRFLASRRGRLLVTAAALVASGAALAVALVGGSGGGGDGRPASLRFTASDVIERTSGPIEGAGLAVDPRGSVTAVWSRAGRVRTTVRAGGGAWSSPVRLSDPGRRATDPAVAARLGGGALVVWREKDAGREVREEVVLPGGRPGGVLRARVGTRWTLWTRASRPDGAWGIPRPLGPSAGGPQDLAEPQVAVTTTGAMVAFVRSGRVWVSEGDGSGPWGRPIPVSGTGGGVATGVRLVTDGAARWAVLTWAARREGTEGRRWQTGVAVRDPGGRWSPAVLLGEPSAARALPSAAVAGDGRVAVGWDAGPTWTVSPGNAGPRVLLALGDPSGAWSGPEEVPAPAAGRVVAMGSPAIGRDGDGATVVVVTRTVLVPRPGGRPSVPPALVLRRDPSGEWAPARRVRPGLGASIVPDAAGGLVVALPGARAGGTLLEALGPDGRARGRAVVEGWASPLLLDTGRDGTTAVGLVLPAGRGARLRVDVAPGGGR